MAANYVGIDGCKAGWFFVGLDEDGAYETGVIHRIDELAPILDAATLVLIDIPIGLPSRDIPNRECDVAARRLIRPRGSSVFPAPTRAAIRCPTYAEGSEENFRQVGKRLSRQSWGIAPKIDEVDRFIRATNCQSKLREMHPEVAFRALNGGRTVLTRKKDAAGFKERMAILSRHLPIASKIVADTRKRYPGKTRLADDDILDALVGAVTARCPLLRTVPDVPLKDEYGITMEIVFAGDPASA